MIFLVQPGGRTFAALQKFKQDSEDAHKAAVQLANEHGFSKWHPDRWAAHGGVESVKFPDDITPPIGWRVDSGNVYVPDRRTKAGKLIFKSLSELPTVSRYELNMCIGYDSRWNRIGVEFMDNGDVVVSIQEKWEINMPDDCIEITTAEYKKRKEEVNTQIHNP